MYSDLVGLLRYTELIKVLVSRDLKARYKKSILGYAWTWLEPLATMFVFILVFDVILSIKVEHFPIFLLTGLIPWLFFSKSISESVNAVVSNASIIRRLYYPREIFPLVTTLQNAVNMLLSLIILIPIIILYQVMITPKILLLPIPTFFLFLLTFGLALICCSMNVFFRDMSYIVPFVIRLLFYLTPIFYTLEGRIPAQYLDMYMILNPLAAIFLLFRTSLMGYPLPGMKYVILSFAVCVLVFIAGYSLFKKYEDLMVKRI
jgi:lipopolysaccharide transport system permease protein